MKVCQIFFLSLCMNKRLIYFHKSDIHTGHVSELILTCDSPPGANPHLCVNAILPSLIFALHVPFECSFKRDPLCPPENSIMAELP